MGTHWWFSRDCLSGGSTSPSTTTVLTDDPGQYHGRINWRYISLVLKNPARRGVFSQGSFFRFVFLRDSVAYAIPIAGCDLMLRNRTSRFRFCATAAR